MHTYAYLLTFMCKYVYVNITVVVQLMYATFFHSTPAFKSHCVGSVFKFYPFTAAAAAAFFFPVV